MSDTKDNTGLTPKERHKIVTKYLKEINKKPKVFHLRWKPGDLIDGNVMKKTPLFWYMRYGWTRPQIETMLFKTKIEIDEILDNGLQQVFGGDHGLRWKGTGVTKPQRKKWKNKAYISQKPYNILANKDLEGKQDNNDNDDNKSNNKGNYLNDNKLKGNELDVWNAVSNFGENEYIDYKQFSDNLKERNINISPDIAKSLFDQIADKKSKNISKKQMNKLMGKLDTLKFDDNFANIGIDDLKTPFGSYTVMKRVLLAAAIGQPFDVDGFLLNTKIDINIGPAGLLLGKLADRDGDWNDRLKAMEMISANIGTNPEFDNLFQPDNAQELLCGWAAQVLDGKPEIQKRAIDDIPLIFNCVLTKGDPDLAIGHLEDMVDNLFKVLNDPNAKKNHEAAKDAVSKLVKGVMNKGDPEAILYLAGTIAEKTKLENSNDPKTRGFALQQLQKIMFGENSPYVMQDKTDPKKIPNIDEDKLPKKATQNREWLDIGCYIQMGPSNVLMYGDKLYDKQKIELLEEQKGNPKPVTYFQNPKLVPSQENAGTIDDMNVDGYAPLETDESTTYQKPKGSSHDPFPENSKNRNRGKVKDISLRWGKGQRDTGAYMQDESSTMKGKNVKSQKSEGKDNKEQIQGSGFEEIMTEGQGVSGPIVVLHCDDRTPKKGQPVHFWVTVRDPNKYNAATEDTNKNNKKPNGPSKDDGPTKPGTKNPHTKKNPYGTGPYKDKDDPSNPKDDINNPNANNPSKKDPNDNTPDDFINPDQKDYIKKYIFDYGDDTPKDEIEKPKSKHPYKKNGPKIAKVTAVDKHGLKGTATIDLDVDGDPNKPKNFGSILDVKINNPEPEKNEPVKVQVQQLGGTGQIKEYKIDWGDGTPIETKKPNEAVQHVYKSGGPKIITIEAIDENGLTGSQQAKVNVKGDPRGPIVALHCDDKTPNVGQSVNFWVTALNPNNPKMEKPISGPGAPKQNQKSGNLGKPNPNYGKPNNKGIYGNPNGPYGDPNKNNPNKNGANATDSNLPGFENPDGLPQIIEYNFDFRDNSPNDIIDEPKTKHPYKKKGPKTASVVATDINGLKGSAEVELDVDGDPNKPKNIGPITSVNVSNDNPEPNEPVKFKVNQLGGTGQIKEYTYDFGDGTEPITTNKPEIEHKYPEDNPGTKVATVKTVDANGLQGISQVKIDVDEPTPVAPCVALHCDDKNPKIGQSVNFWVTALDPNDPKNNNGGPKRNYGKTNHGGPVQYPKNGKGGHTGYVPYDAIDTTDDDNKNDEPNAPSYRKPGEKFGPNEPGKQNKGPKGQDYGDPNVNNPNSNGPNAIDNNLPGFIDPNKIPNIVKYDFDFGDKTPHDLTDKPKSQHAYKTKGPKTASVVTTDVNGLTSTSEIDLDIQGKPNKPKNIGPVIAATIDKPKCRRYEPVIIDVIQLGGSAPIKEYIFDFGDGSPYEHTKKPTAIHKYPKKGVVTPTIQAIDNNGLTGTTQVRVKIAGGYAMDEDDDPGKSRGNPSKKHKSNKTQANKSYPGYAGTTNNIDDKYEPPLSNDKNKQGNDDNLDDLTPREIGDEFRNILTEAVKDAIMDPNKKNSDKGKKMTDLMNELNPKWDKNLDPEARKRYIKYKGPPLKPYKPMRGPPKKKLPGLVVGKKRVHQIDQTFSINIQGPTLPDI